MTTCILACYCCVVGLLRSLPSVSLFVCLHVYETNATKYTFVGVLLLTERQSWYCVLGQFAMYCRAVWMEGSREMEGVIPSKWIVDGSVLYPSKNAKTAAETRCSPLSGWRKFRLVKKKLFSGECQV